MSSKKPPKGGQLVTNPYNSEGSANRPGVMLTGPWTNDLAEFVKNEDIKAIYLNSAKGWTGSDYSFLKNLENIEELNIISAKGNELVSIESMTNLRELSITCASSDTIDFTNLPNLETAYIYWWKGASSILHCSSLKSLYLDSAKLKDYSPLGELKDLNALTIANSNVESLSFLESLESLNRLELLNLKKLSQFNEIASCKALGRLTISGSKLLSNLDFVRNLHNLEVLVVSDNGDIQSLEPLSNLKSIKALSFAGSSDIKDGDLSILEKLPNLAMLMFRERKHYSHKLIKKWNWDNFNTPDTLLEQK